MIAPPLRYFRNLNNWTQEYVARSLKISQAAYSKLENGFTTVSEGTAEVLANLYKIDKKSFYQTNINYQTLLKLHMTMILICYVFK